MLQVVRPAAGGIRRHLELLCGGLAAQGVRLLLAAPADFALTLPPGVFLPRTPIPLRSRPHPFDDLRSVGGIRQAARNVEVLHAHGLRAAWVTGLAARRLRQPFVFTAHNLAPPPGTLTRFLAGLALRRADSVICITQAVADTLAPYGVPPAHIVLISNGIDLAPFDTPRDPAAFLRAHGIPPDALLVAAMGRHAPEKGFDVLLDAVPQVLRTFPQAFFVVAGEGAETESLRSQAARLNILPQVRFPGRITESADLFAAAALVAVPSRSEGQGLVALEAMAARRAVVGSRVGGLAETVAEDETGLLVAPNDPAALADALTTLLGDAARRTRLGQQGRLQVESCCTQAQMVAATLACYERVLHGESRRQR